MSSKFAPVEVRSHITKMHLPPPPVERPPERGSWGAVILVVLGFAVAAPIAAYILL